VFLAPEGYGLRQVMSNWKRSRPRRPGDRHRRGGELAAAAPTTSSSCRGPGISASPGPWSPLHPAITIALLRGGDIDKLRNLAKSSP